MPIFRKKLAAKKYKSHRRVPDSIYNELELNNANK